MAGSDSKGGLIDSLRSQKQSILIAACFGLLSGLGEGINAWIFSIVPDHLGWKNDLLPEILWIAPVFDLLLFSALAVPVIILSRLFPKIRTDLLVYSIFGWLSVYGFLSASGRLHRVTCAVLGVAVAVQLCSYFRSRSTLSMVLVMRVFASLSLVTLLMNLLGVITKVGQAESSKPPIPVVAARVPNILLIVLDTLRADHLSSYGYSRKTTPNLDELAHEGTLFEDAFATASWTLPSHASMMTGRYLYEHRAGGSPLDGKFPTLAEVLSSLGYVTAGFVANNEYCSVKSGLSRGFSTYEDHFSTVADMGWRTYYGNLLLNELPQMGYYDYPGRKHASEVNREFFSWLERNHNTRFFAFLNYFDVHDPYIAPSPYRTEFNTQPNQGNLVNSLLFPRDFTGGRKLTGEEVQAEIDAYDGCLAYLDNQLGSLFDRLRVMGLLDSTLIIITSDHGESFDDHGFYGHGNNLYRNLTHVPLIIRYPSKVPTGLRIPEAVSLGTIPASVMDLLGFNSRSPFPGIPLSTHWSGLLALRSELKGLAFAESLKGIVHSPAYPLGRRGISKSLMSSKWNLILHEESEAELFDTIHDSAESNNLATTPEGKAIVKQFGQEMKNLMTNEDWKIFCTQLDSCDRQ